VPLFTGLLVKIVRKSKRLFRFCFSKNEITNQIMYNLTIGQIVQLSDIQSVTVSGKFFKKKSP